MSHDTEYCIDQIQKRLVGGKITGAITDEEGEFFGIKVTRGGMDYKVWIDRDAEGNGPGWMTIEHDYREQTEFPPPKDGDETINRG